MALAAFLAQYPIDDFGRSVKTIACPFDLTAAALTPH
jgi:hypothetical protein